SADGRRVLTWMRTGDSDPWIVDIGTRGLTRLATGVAARRATWSPDGRTVMFDARSADNPVSLFVVDTQGGPPRRLRAEKNSQYAGTWTPDGRTLVFVDLTKAGYDIYATTNEPLGPRTAILNTPANETAPAFSPDGKRLAFVSDGTGKEIGRAHV